ncbi:MAG: hypothetical protein C0425_02270 [Chlorobiaceae bacterium]|nr:hypothetical protein [Chlorobiaceae bacterium]MBA4309145.1 hypothetical protein [Chlorobiaceae bacterium]
MNTKEIRRSLLRFVGNVSIVFLSNLLCKSLRLELINNDKFEAVVKDGKCVVGFWHGTMFYVWYFLRDKNFLGLTSQSKDGDLLAKNLRHWNYKVIRGSSSKDGDVALGILVDYAKNQGSVALTPDGPRGPKYKLKAGAVVTAKKSNLPLFLVGVAYEKKRVLHKSWDSFEIPKFFSKVRLVFSDPIYVNENLTYEETSKMIENCEVELNRVQNEASRFALSERA